MLYVWTGTTKLIYGRCFRDMLQRHALIQRDHILWKVTAASCFLSVTFVVPQSAEFGCFCHSSTRLHVVFVFCERWCSPFYVLYWWDAINRDNQWRVIGLHLGMFYCCWYSKRHQHRQCSVTYRCLSRSLWQVVAQIRKSGFQIDDNVSTWHTIPLWNIYLW